MKDRVQKFGARQDYTGLVLREKPCEVVEGFLLRGNSAAGVKVSARARAKMSIIEKRRNVLAHQR